MITPLDMARTFIQKKNKFQKSKKNMFADKMNAYVDIILKNISKQLDRDFNIETREGFIAQIDFFINSSNEDLLNIVNSNIHDEYFLDLAKGELFEYLETFRVEYPREKLLRLYNLKNYRR